MRRVLAPALFSFFVSAASIATAEYSPTPVPSPTPTSVDTPVSLFTQRAYAGAGDTGWIEFPLHVKRESAQSLLNAEMVVKINPNELGDVGLADVGDSGLSATTIPPGFKATYSFHYFVPNNKFEGPVKIDLSLLSPTTNVLPVLSKYNTSRTIYVDSRPPTVVVTGLFTELFDHVARGDSGNVTRIYDTPPLVPVPNIIVGNAVKIGVEEQGAFPVKIVIKNAATNAVVADLSFDKADESAALSLSEADYSVTAVDGASNTTSGHFKVDYGISAEFLSTSVDARSFSAISRATWGVKAVKLVDMSDTGPDVNSFSDPSLIPSFRPEYQFAYEPGQAEVAYSMANIPDGEYQVLAVDQENVSSMMHRWSTIELFQAFEAGSEVPHLVIETFYETPPFFTATGKVLLARSSDRSYPLEIALSGVTDPGATGAWLSRAANELQSENSFTDPQGSDIQFNMLTTGVSTGPTTITVGYDERGLTPAQEAGLQLIQFKESGPVDVTASIDTTSRTIVGVVDTFDSFVIQVPAPATFTYIAQTSTQIGGAPELEIESYRGNLALRDATTGETGSGLAALKAQKGLVPLGRVYALDPEAETVYFRPRAVLRARFDPGLAPPGSDVGGFLYYSTDGFHTVHESADPIVDASSGTSKGELSSLIAGAPTFVAVMGRRVPPDTALAPLGPSYSSGTVLVVSSGAGLRLVPSQGESVPYLSLDGGAFVARPSSFVVTEGTHSLVYYSQSAEGGVGERKSVALAADGTPPVTEFSFSQAVSTVSGVTSMPSGTFISFQSSDPVTQGVSAGVRAIRFLIDVSSAACANGLFAEPDGAMPQGTCRNTTWNGGELASGFHRVLYAAQDAVGNTEETRELQIFVLGSPHSGGLGIGRDAADQLWTIVSGGESVALARVDADGALVSSATLPDGQPGTQWAVLFDEVGRTFAVGTAQGPSTLGADLAVYRASPGGDAIASSSTFDSGFSNNDYAFDAAAPGWIVGAAQTAGPVQEGDPGSPAFSLALWRLDTAQGLIELATSYTRGPGLDVGTGVALDGAGNVWVSGFSQGVTPDPERPIDLALWKFSSAGALLAGPFLRPAYLANVDGGQVARVLVSGGHVFVSAPRTRSGGGMDLALAKFDAASGDFIAESFWRPTTGSAYPAAILAEGGGLLVAGSLDDGGTQAGLWHYELSAATVTAASVNAGGAQGAVFRGGDLWLTVDGATSPYRVSSQSPASGSFVDAQPPRTSLAAAPPSYLGDKLYATTATSFTFTVADDRAAAGDGLGSGSTATYASIDGSPYGIQSGPVTFLEEGLHLISFYSVDLAGNTEQTSSRTVAIDMTAPEAALVSSGTLYAIEAIDVSSVGAASGVAKLEYLVDTDPETCPEGQSSTAAAPGTCANFHYAGPFSLAPGTHTVIFVATDNLGNGNDILHSSYVVVAGGEVSPLAVVPFTGPIGIPFTISGSGFGAYGGSNTRVRFGATIAPVSVWNDTTINGTIPGLSTGAYAVDIERQHASSMTSVSAGVFTVTGLEPQAVSITSGPIGIPFSITGSGFGPYNGTMSRVMIGGTTAPLSLWNDTAIAGTIPGVPPGETVIYLVRTTSDGGIFQSEEVPFTVTVPSVATISPSSGPIGAAFALSGVSFGPYAGSNSIVLIGGATAPVSIWNDGAIAGTIPGTLLPGVHPVIVERRTSDGGLSRSSMVHFEVTGLGLSSLNPSTGPIGIPFTINGAGFGAYGGSNTRVKFGDTVASVSLWNNTTINGTVPNLSTGVWTVVVERQQGASVSQSNVSSFTLTSLEIATLTPSSGSIGAPFTITGTGYGPYAGTNSRVLIGGATATLSVWNDATITGTIPALPAGPHAVRLERVSGAGLQVSAEAELLVVDPAIAAMAPSSGPIGIAFTVTGAGFGPYGGANTVLLIGGSTAPVSLWNDTTIKGTIPGSLPTGLKSVVVKRIAGGGSATSNAAEFQVTGMSLNAVNPSSGSIGAPFTITGTQFGAYGGSNTRVRMGGVVTAVSVWNDTTISGTIPNLTPGVVDLVVERQQGAITALSNFSSFTVVGMSPAGLSPENGPIGTAFTLTGSGFGPYGGSNTRVLVAGITASVSLWNDTTIKGTIPAANAGEQPIWIERQLGAAVQSSDTGYFTITVPSLASMTPSSAPIGAPFTLTGTSFGVYGGANTRVKFNGIVAPVSVWNDTTITGTVPGVLTPGEVELVVERAAGTGLSSSATQAFLVLLPTVSTITPGYGPAGTVVTLTGSGFGPYGGALTKVLVGGATTAVSVWNNTTIRWTVPASLSDGEYPVIVRRSPSGGTADSEPVYFTVGTGYGTSSFGFTQTMSLASTPDSHFEGDLALSSTTGGRIDTPAKAAVEIPPNAMEEDTSITVKRAHSDGLRNSAAEDILKRAAGEPIEFGPEGTRFATPVTIELPYDPALIADETKIAIHYFNPLRREWEELASVVDRARKVVTAKTDHFSIYQPMGLAPTATSQDEFYYRDAYAFPNPSRGGALVTFRIQPGLAETIELRVYDLSGRKVHDSSDFTFRGAFDDGNGKGAQNTYDHTWSVSGVGSGIYTFVMKASQRGNKPIVKSGKVGVIK